MRFLRTNTAVIISVGPFYDKADGVTPETALTITNERITLVADTDAGSAPTLILDNVTGATAGTDNDLNYITGQDNGMMQLELSAANTNRLGRMILTITDAANHVPVFHEFMVLPAMIYDAFILGTDTLHADMQQILGTAVSTPATAGILDVNVKNIDNDAASASGTVTFPNATLASTTNITAGTITTATNVTTVNGLAANVITAASINTGAIDADALAADAVAEIADGVWDEDATGHQTGGTFGQAIGDPGADTNTIFKAVVTDATGATVGVDVAAVLADTGTDGVVVAGLTSAALADFFDTDSGTTFASAVAGSVVKEIVDNAGGGTAPTAAEVADAVWDEDATGHQTQGSFGQVLGDSGATATSVWGRVTTALPNATAGAAGGVFIAGTNAPVTITGSGNALTISSSGGNGSGIVVSGNGTGDGIYIDSGSSAGGRGIYVVGKTDGAKIYSYGDGLHIFGEVRGFYVDSDTSHAISVHAADGDGIYVLSDSAGDSGLNIKSGAANGRAISLRATGAGTGIGLYIDAELAAIQAGAFGAGGKAIDLYSNGEGIVISALSGDAIHVESKGGDGDGISITGHGAGEGISITGGANGRGVYINYGASIVETRNGSAALFVQSSGTGAAHAVLLQAGGDGDGISVSGYGTGAGISVTGGATDGDGIVVTGQGAGADIRADITGSLSGTIGGLTVAAVKDFFDTDSGTTFASAVAGSVVKEIADNAGGSSLTLGDIADAVMDEAADGATTLRQSIRLWNAALGGKASGLGTTTAVFRDLADSKDRITATVDSNGNRAAVTRDLT